jgi:hypothetical protein
VQHGAGKVGSQAALLTGRGLGTVSGAPDCPFCYFLSGLPFSTCGLSSVQFLQAGAIFLSSLYPTGVPYVGKQAVGISDWIDDLDEVARRFLAPSTSNALDEIQRKEETNMACMIQFAPAMATTQFACELLRKCDEPARKPGYYRKWNSTHELGRGHRGRRYAGIKNKVETLSK